MTEKDNAELDRLRCCLRDCLDVIQQIHKGSAAGIPPEKVTPGLYVVDWRIESDCIDTVRVERVVEVKDGIVTFDPPSITDITTFAYVVLAGPFK